MVIETQQPADQLQYHECDELGVGGGIHSSHAFKSPITSGAQ